MASLYPSTTCTGGKYRLLLAVTAHDIVYLKLAISQANAGVSIAASIKKIASYVQVHAHVLLRLLHIATCGILWYILYR